MSSCRVFQSLGPATANYRSPTIISCDRGTTGSEESTTGDGVLMWCQQRGVSDQTDTNVQYTGGGADKSKPPKFSPPKLSAVFQHTCAVKVLASLFTEVFWDMSKSSIRVFFSVGALPRTPLGVVRLEKDNSSLFSITINTFSISFSPSL